MRYMITQIIPAQPGWEIQVAEDNSDVRAIMAQVVAWGLCEVYFFNQKGNEERDANRVEPLVVSPGGAGIDVDLARLVYPKGRIFLMFKGMVEGTTENR